MRQAQFDLNAKATTSRKNRRPAFTVGVGVIALAIAAGIVVEERSGPPSAGSDPAHSSVVPLAATAAEGGTAITNTMSVSDPAKPHFERSDEPAYEDSVQPHGG